ILSNMGLATSFSVHLVAVLVMLLLIMPLAMIFSALLIAISIFAKTYKEAQAYISPLMILVIIPAIIPMIAQTMELNTSLVFVPIINVSLILKDVFIGEYNWGYIWLIFLSTGFYAGIFLLVATWLFHQEKVLFRT
ncbi:MAG: ABC transporter permease subunit, partial [Planctomycetota bacterium]|nr:ABC transporter permease subunit [Planctomycetota bacterium]